MAQKYILLQYLFIAIFCAKMSRVNKALISDKDIWRNPTLEEPLTGLIGIKIKEL